MPYHSDFDGRIEIDPPLNSDERTFLLDFSATRHIQSGNGPLYVGRGRAAHVIDFNNPPAELPGLWCEWVPTDAGDALEASDAEGFYHPVEWMQFVVHYLLADTAVPFIEQHKHDDPRLDSFTCDHTLNGTIQVYGQEHDDVWRLTVRNNLVHIAAGSI